MESPPIVNGKPFNAKAVAIQKRATDEIVSCIRAGKDVLLVSPTGSGKTKMLADAFMELSQDDAFKGLILQNRQKLAEQNQQRAIQYGMDPSRTALVMDGEISDAARNASIVYALPQTLAGRTDQIGRRTVAAIDEAHHATDDAGSQVASVLNDLTRKNKKLMLVGTTASPYAPEGSQMHPRLEKAHRITITFQEAIDAGMITQIRTETPDYRLKDGTWLRDAIDKKLDDRNVKDTKAGLHSLIDKGRPDNFDEVVLRDMRRRGIDNKQTLSFEDTIKDAVAFAKSLNESGIPAGVIHSKMKPSEITDTIEKYNNGDIRVLSSVDMIGEGFDAPATEVIINRKKTTSLAEHIQIGGRAMRIFGDKGEGLYIDWGASTAIHGKLEDFFKTQHYVARGGTTHDAWVGLKEEPFVQGLCTGKDVFFAIGVRDSGGQVGYHVLRSYTDKKTETRRLEHIAEPGSTKKTMSPERLVQFTRDAIAVNETSYTRLLSRTSMQRQDGTEVTMPKANVILSTLWNHQGATALTMMQGTPISKQAFEDLAKQQADRPQDMPIGAIKKAKTKKIGQEIDL